MDMRYPLALLVALLALAPKAQAQADIHVLSSAAPTKGLEIGSEVIVTATLRNAGTQSILWPVGKMSLQESEPFWFEFVGTITPGCEFKRSEYFPEQFVYEWEAQRLEVGQQLSCAVKLRVQMVPPSGFARLAVDGDHHGVEETGSNNHTSLDFFFGDHVGVSGRAIPAASPTVLILIGLGALLVAWRKREILRRNEE
jgi:hypothetical protein